MMEVSDYPAIKDSEWKDSGLNRYQGYKIQQTV